MFFYLVSYAYTRTLKSTEKKFFVTSLIALVLLSKKNDFPGLFFAARDFWSISLKVTSVDRDCRKKLNAMQKLLNFVKFVVFVKRNRKTESVKKTVLHLVQL